MGLSLQIPSRDPSRSKFAMEIERRAGRNRPNRVSAGEIDSLDDEHFDTHFSTINIIHYILKPLFWLLKPRSTLEKSTTM
jgi:hypothetical protein